MILLYLGENIPIDARIIAVADAYDAMTSERSYRTRKLKSNEGLEELQRCAGKQFDPAIVEVFIDLNMETPRNTARVEDSVVRAFGQ
ncbi:HD-GYP domain-containing protein [Chloroflexota bacterium]